MGTEHWALLVSVIALIVSIGIPIWQWRSTSAQTIASKRTLLLQTILSTKSVTHVSMWELIGLLNRHGHEMRPKIRADAANMLQALQEHHDALETLHRKWSDYSGVETLSRIEQALSDVDVTSSDAKDTSRLVETFVKNAIDSLVVQKQLR